MKQLHHLRTSADMGVTNTDIEYVAYLEGIPDSDKEHWVKLMKEIPDIDFGKSQISPYRDYPNLCLQP